MHMIRHNHKSVQLIFRLFPIPNSLNHHFSYFRPLQINRPPLTRVQHPIHSHKSPARHNRIRKPAPHRQTPGQSPRDKHRPADLHNMRQPSNIISSHTTAVPASTQTSHQKLIEFSGPVESFTFEEFQQFSENSPTHHQPMWGRLATCGGLAIRLARTPNQAHS
jgi:hypothetical protein